MPCQLAPNQPYDLTTEHGRAQSVAYSAYGAMLANVVENCLEEVEIDIANNLEELITKELEHLNPVDAESADLLAEMSIFRQELGKRDAKEFDAILSAYSAEHSALAGNIRILLALVEQIKAMVGIEDEE